ncbi:MAG: hypothetical protein FWH08_03615 [Oscillospiraceae bacterium]|nr:hypothetical protein [Oscillospiraceae bacterium]
MFKFCPECGKGCEGMKFCPECGYNLASSSPAQPQPVPPMQPVQQPLQDDTPRCPKCGSANLSSNKKGFGVGKAAVGRAVLRRPIGLAAGNIGANKIQITCLQCGYSYTAGK